MMNSPGRREYVFTALAVLGLLGPRIAAAAPVTYIALGDSLAFGVGLNDTGVTTDFARRSIATGS